MNKDLLRRHINIFISEIHNEPDKFNEEWRERQDLLSYYQGFARDRILQMTDEDIYNYISKLWAMEIWGNKHYVVDKIIQDNGRQQFKKHLADLVWGKRPIGERWDDFRSAIKGMGPAMMSEILCKTHPDDYMLWNRRAYVALNYLNVAKLPRYDYQISGDVYKHLCTVVKEIADELRIAGSKDVTLLAVDYFLWQKLQVEDNLSKIQKNKPPTVAKTDSKLPREAEFIHNDIRDKLSDIGDWLGFKSRIEQKVSEGSKVDTVWEATIGNMGRVIYVFEVQTRGSIDSLILNLLKSLNNPAVQGVIAVSDKKQLETVQRHARDVKELKDKLKYWNYEEVLKIHEYLAYVNESINNLGLVPHGF